MAVQLIEPRSESPGITYEEYLQIPEMMARYDIVDGVMYMSPAPTDVHQWDLSRLNDLIKSYVTANDLGVALFAPMDLIIRKLPKLTTRQPDLAYFSWEAIGGRGLEALVAARRNGVVPDLAVELLSPDQSKRTLRGKLADFASLGIPEVWLGKREDVTVEVLVLKDGQYVSAGVYSNAQKVVSRVLPGLEIQVDSIFVD